MSGAPTLQVWQLRMPAQGQTKSKRFFGANLINLEFVNIKISVDIPGVTVRRIGAPTFDMHTCRLALARSLRCACPARGSDQGMQV